MENKKMNITMKKELKEKELLSAAYKLFTSRGIEKTSIDDIVKMAKVGKGTFYLYFKDKYEILNKIILKKSNCIIKDCLEKTDKLGIVDFKERTLIFIDYIIKFFEENKSLLKLINKNISWGLYRKAIMDPKEYEEVKHVLNVFINNLINEGMNKDEAEMTLFMIIELVGSVCYTTIIFKEPTDINTIRPVLLKKVKAMIED
ncbi:TetR/AcrR family transcriptional regulator [uncultured Clostridium sp.]|uniref:TetR/AcrR family transcriptional regulator n=1 Tax=uncultured Clostridium sp. TaxID=59620 RepID=UPI0025D0F2B2|nr:TetR/AcrR family transcriptional regulator [uncultured Clostridium sp.]